MQLRICLTSSLLLLSFKCLQVQLRRAVQSLGDSDSDLYQWFEGSKLCSGAIESLITLEDDREAIEIKVRGPPTSELSCFYFVEELLGLVDQVYSKIITLILLEFTAIWLFFCCIGQQITIPSAVRQLKIFHYC